MLDFETCKRLKEAGFPQLIDTTRFWECLGKGGVWERRTGQSWEETEFFAPCGAIGYDDVASIQPPDTTGEIEVFYCPTLEELFANLPNLKTVTRTEGWLVDGVEEETLEKALASLYMKR